MRQLTFATPPSFEKFARKSRREEFLSTMQAVLPWAELEARIAPHYPKAGKGRHPVGLSVILRIYFCNIGSRSLTPAQRTHSMSRQPVHG